MANNQELIERQQGAVCAGVATKSIYASRAKNAEVWDVEGRRYIDFASGIAVTNTGHCHPKVMAAVAEQMQSFTHTCFHVVPYESYISLAERLNGLVDTGEENRTMFATTGVEAVENAVKIARAATGRPAVIAFGGGFHGRTLMGMALTGKRMPYKNNFGPFPGEIHHAPFPDAYHGMSVDMAKNALQDLFNWRLAPQQVAAIIIEPVQGEGGFNVAPAEFLVHLRQFADDHGIVLISDEVQAGAARTGSFVAISQAGVQPDIVTMAKGLAGGFPLSAVVGKKRIMDAASPGGLGGTYAGSPIGIAAAHAVLDVIEEMGLNQRAHDIGQKITNFLTELANRQGMDAIGDVRGQGAMVAFELVKDRHTREPDSALTGRIVAEAEKRGLILLSCGMHGNVVRILTALTIEDEILQEGLGLLGVAVEAACDVEAAA